MRIALVSLTLLLSSCAAVSTASVSDQEKVLVSAGFTRRNVTTPQQLQALSNLPPTKLMRVTSGSRVAYYYADANGCHCVYYGTPEAYRALRSPLSGGSTPTNDQFEPTDVNGVNPAELVF